VKLGKNAHFMGFSLLFQQTNAFPQKALVIAARLPIMRPYQHGGQRQTDEPASL
jgi:hypothetical protein